MIEKWSKKVRGEEGRNKSVESTGNYLLPAWKRREKEKMGGKEERWREGRKEGRKEGERGKERSKEAMKKRMI